MTRTTSAGLGGVEAGELTQEGAVWLLARRHRLHYLGPGDILRSPCALGSMLSRLDLLNRRRCGWGLSYRKRRPHELVGHLSTTTCLIRQALHISTFELTVPVSVTTPFCDVT